MFDTGTGSTHFYHGSARKIVAAFGSMFNKVVGARYDSDGNIVKKFAVPIAYSGQQHYIKKLRQDLSENAVAIDTVLPRMSFSLESLIYDPTRQLHPASYMKVNDPNDYSILHKRWNPVPYTYYFNVGVYSKNMEDGLQLIEQIVPWFSPSFNMPVIMVDDVTIDVPVTLTNVTFEDNDMEGFTENRMLTWNISFEAKGLFFKPINTPTVVDTAIIDMHDDSEFSEPVELGTITELDPVYIVTEDKYNIADDDGYLIVATET